jgi:hypothetical protein
MHAMNRGRLCGHPPEMVGNPSTPLSTSPPSVEAVLCLCQLSRRRVSRLRVHRSPSSGKIETATDESTPTTPTDSCTLAESTRRQLSHERQRLRLTATSPCYGGGLPPLVESPLAGPTAWETQPALRGPSDHRHRLVRSPGNHSLAPPQAPPLHRRDEPGHFTAAVRRPPPPNTRRSPPSARF